MKFTKRVVTLVLGIIIVIGLCTVSYAADSKNEEEKWGYLFHGELNIRIYAKLSDLMAFATAANETVREQALQCLTSNPSNIVTELEYSPFDRISNNSIENEVDVEATRTPGTWNISPFTVPAFSQGTSIGPATAAAFDVAWNETVHIRYTCSPDRMIAVECKTATPSAYYDPGYYSGIDTMWYPGSSGQYRIYFRNYDPIAASITGGFVKIF